MPNLDCIISVVLDGESPSELTLPPFVGGNASCDWMSCALRPFAHNNCRELRINCLEDFEAVEPAAGTIVAYLVGHGWTGTDGRFAVSIRSGKGPTILSGHELLSLMGCCISPGSRLILLVDTCEASALKLDLQTLECTDLTALFASVQGTRAWNLVSDGATQFAFEASRALDRFRHKKRVFDAIELAAVLNTRLDRQSMGFSQRVTYRVQGDEISLSSLSPQELIERQSKAFRRIRNLLLGIGAGVVSVLFGSGTYWNNHAFVTIDLGDLSRVTNSAVVNLYELLPDENGRVRVRSQSVQGSESLRMFVPAADCLIEVSCSYADGKPREIRFHRSFLPGLWQDKLAHFSIPSADEIVRRPQMAYVSAESWLKGDPPSRVVGPPPFWIDIAPPTLGEYLPFLLGAYSDGRLEAHESMLLWHLTNKLGTSEEDFNAGVSRIVERVSAEDGPYSDLTCPAPMTEREVRLYLRSVAKELPTRQQWELAVRGVDGRTFPWGNRKDEARINAGLPRKVGWEGRQRLKAVSEYADSDSPFGVVDTVGNAGDWVEEDRGESPDQLPIGIGFMGGVFQFNVDDCTTFSFMRLPSSESESLPARGFWMITGRGIIPAK